MNNNNYNGGFISYHLGCDLGKQHDYTAITILRKVRPIDRFSTVIEGIEPQLEVVSIKRFPLRKSYTQIVTEISDRLKTEPFSSRKGFRPAKVSLAVDQTGLGQVVADMMREDDFLMNRLERFHAVNITGGRDVHEKPQSINIPKVELVMQTLVSLEQGNLKFAANLAELSALIAELQAFEMRHTAAGNQTFNGKAGTHDDMVISLALAVWSARNTYEPTFEDEQRLRLAFFGSWQEQQRARKQFNRW